jgi:hypothetical protein
MSEDYPPEYIPLIFALKDLTIRYYPDMAGSPDFSKAACLMRGGTVLSKVDDNTVDAYLQGGPFNPPESNPMDEMMRKMEFSAWPDDSFVAVLGIFAFGPGDVERAKVCARYSLQLNRDCTLARQLLQILSEKTDPRIPFKDMQTELRDVLSAVAGKSQTDS